MASFDYTVRRVPIERTLTLRKAVLRPHLPEDEPYVLPDDHLPTTVAFGAVTTDGELIGIGRLTPEPPPFKGEGERGWRLRGMATTPEVRNMGVGSAILEAIMRHVSQAGGGILWCNARLAALGLYRRAGMQEWGEVWEETNIGPHVVMWRRIV